jgi:hypothetical protein
MPHIDVKDLLKTQLKYVYENRINTIVMLEEGRIG